MSDNSGSNDSWQRAIDEIRSLSESDNRRYELYGYSYLDEIRLPDEQRELLSCADSILSDIRANGEFKLGQTEQALELLYKRGIIARDASGTYTFTTKGKRLFE